VSSSLPSTPPILPQAQLEIRADEGAAELHAVGNWTVKGIAPADAALRQFIASADAFTRVGIHLQAVEHLDTAGAWLLYRTVLALNERGIRTSFSGLNDRQRQLLAEVESYAGTLPPQEPGYTGFKSFLAGFGLRLELLMHDAVTMLGFLGLILQTLWRAIKSPRRMRMTSLVFHLERTTLEAIPIVALITFLIGGVVVRQGAEQLRQFGADVFTIDLLGISILREFGILLTAIMVAGRSGSAFTAHIGSMKIREEIDALRTLGLDPMELLVLPRVLALTLGLPFLTFIADMAGILGGGLVSWIFLDFSPAAFLSRLNEAVPLWSFGVGLLKAPFMGLIIGLIGCLEGMKVSGSAESVGQHTTASVVKSIFVVICADAGFAMFFTAIGI
jgi:phospholipid/cholesterol/gamma-HCH transport system permease protein